VEAGDEMTKGFFGEIVRAQVSGEGGVAEGREGGREGRVRW